MTNLDDVLTQILLEGSREMEPMLDHQVPASDQSHHELYPLLLIQLPICSHKYKTTEFIFSQLSFNWSAFLNLPQVRLGHQNCYDRNV